MVDPAQVLLNPDPRYHLDFPAVTLASNGDVLLLARQCGPWGRDATFKFGRTLTFFETEAETVLLRSTDAGSSFSYERSLHKGLAFDQTLCTLADGTLAAGVVLGEAGARRDRAGLRGVLHRQLPQLDTVITVRGAGLWFSRADGQSWSAEPILASLPGWENLYNLRPPFQLADGTIILPVAVGYPWRSRYVGLIRSWDDGATWSDPSFVAEDPGGRAHYAAGNGYWKPTMAATPGGDLLCVCVLNDRLAEQRRQAAEPAGRGVDAATDVSPLMMRTHSTDSGFTWSVPQDTGLRGDFPSLTVLRDGRLLLTHAQQRTDGPAVLAHLSDDGGLTWELAETVRSASDSMFYYPTSIVLPDETLLTVCMTTPPGGVRVVEVVRWRL